MRILFLSNVPPGSVGGAEVQALHLARHWSEKGHKVIVAGYANQSFISENLSIIHIPAFQQSRALRSTLEDSTHELGLNNYVEFIGALN